MLQTVAFHALFLSESSATVLTFIGADTCVNTLVSGNLRGLEEFLTAVFAAQFEIFSSEHFGPLSNQFQAGLQFLMSQLMLFEVLGVFTDFATSFALKRMVFRVANNIVGCWQ